MTVTHFADHSLLLAIPAFAPAVVVVGVVMFIAMRDRHRVDDENADDEAHSERPDDTDDDGTP